MNMHLRQRPEWQTVTQYHLDLHIKMFIRDTQGCERGHRILFPEPEPVKPCPMNNEEIALHVAVDIGLACLAMDLGKASHKPLVTLLYILARDHLPTGTLVSIRKDHARADIDPVFTDKHLEAWARDYASKLIGYRLEP